MDFVFGNPEDIPEEVKAFLDRRVMETQDKDNRVKHFIEEQSLDSLVTLRFLLREMQDSPMTAAFYEGVVAATLQHGYPDVCHVCGIVHEDEDFHPEGSEEKAKEESVESKEFASLFPKAESSAVADQFARYSVEYNVLPVSEERLLGPVECQGCGLRYPSLEDRMRSEPGEEGCEGCIQKTKWG